MMRAAHDMLGCLVVVGGWGVGGGVVVIVVAVVVVALTIACRAAPLVVVGVVSVVYTKSKHQWRIAGDYMCCLWVFKRQGGEDREGETLEKRHGEREGGLTGFVHTS